MRPEPELAQPGWLVVAEQPRRELHLPCPGPVTPPVGRLAPSPTGLLHLGHARTFWIADVPFTQYFHGPFALHASFWHEDFGEMKSSGCVNLSPADAEWLFRWTGPVVPDGWQAAGRGGPNGEGP